MLRTFSLIKKYLPGTSNNKYWLTAHEMIFKNLKYYYLIALPYKIITNLFQISFDKCVLKSSWDMCFAPGLWHLSKSPYFIYSSQAGYFCVSIISDQRDYHSISSSFSCVWVSCYHLLLAETIAESRKVLERDFYSLSISSSQNRLLTPASFSLWESSFNYWSR